MKFKELRLRILNFSLQKTEFLKDKGLLLLFVIFLFMYALNVMTPLLSDDYFISFVWPEGMRINGILPNDARKVSSLSDVLDSIKAYYFIWGGRIPGQTLMTLFAWWGKEYFNIINSFMAILLIMEIYWISHEGNINLRFNYKYIFWIFFALWVFNMAFVDTFLWLSGSCEYLWLMVLLLAFLLPYVQNYYNLNKHKSDNPLFTFCMFIMGVIAGCSRETLICWIIIILLYWLVLCKKADNCQSWKVSGLFGLFLGYTILILAPGNFARLASDSHTDSILLVSFPVLIFKIIFISIIILFHFFLWHFSLSFFLRHKKEQKKMQQKSILAYKNVVIAQVSFLVALGTTVLLFAIMYSGARPSFVTLICLIIVVASLFRASELSQISIINEYVVRVLKKVGCIYFAVTISFSSYWNYENSKQWERILQSMIVGSQTATNEVSPMIYPLERKQLIEKANELLGNSTEIWYGAHIIKMPVLLEGSYYNIIIPRYYNIKR